MHLAHGVTLFIHGVTYFQQRVILEQNFVDLIHIVKNEIQDEIWTVKFFLGQILAVNYSDGPSLPQIQKQSSYLLTQLCNDEPYQ